MSKEIIIDGVVYELTPKKTGKELTDEEFITSLKKELKLNYDIGDTVWFKGVTNQTEPSVNEDKFEVMRFDVYRIDGKRVDSYLTVIVKDKKGKYVSHLSLHLERYYEPKTKLSELTKKDRITGMRFYDGKLTQKGKAVISFSEDKKYPNYVNFSTFDNDTEHGLGCSSAIRLEKFTDRGYFLSEFGSRSYYFFTLNPDNWKEDFKKAFDEHIEFKKQSFKEEIEHYKGECKFILSA